jgi:4-hydroxyphenylacetate 3-monooxygenase
MPAEITRNLFMTAYPRMVEILQLLGSSSFMIIPSEADFATLLAPDIEQYLATHTATASNSSASPGISRVARSAAGRCSTTLLRERPVDSGARLKCA